MIEEMLRSKIGLNVESVGSDKISSDIARRMSACGLASISEYERLLLCSTEEMERLIDAVTIPETWFFRSKDSFDCLESFIRDEWMPAQILKGQRQLRILSAPCSSGEEPYSISMLLLECGLSPENFAIDAFDISGRSIEKAKEGVYTKNSFRGERPELVVKYFTAAEGRYRIATKVMAPVRLSRRNLLELPLQVRPEERYSLIFCRNMLIYLDDPAQRRAVDIISGLLEDVGLLFLGHAEAWLMSMRPGFAPAKTKGSFAYRKTPPSSLPPVQHFDVPTTDTQKLLKIDLSAEIAAHSSHRKGSLRPREPKQATHTTPSFNPDDEKLLSIAQDFANRGDVKSALAASKAYIASHKLDPKGYYTLGVLLAASGREPESESFLNKAIFLKPDYYEALLHLASLREKRGDHDSSRLFKERAARIGANE